MCVRYVASADNYVDITTKPLVHAKFQICRALCASMKSDLKHAPIVQQEDEEVVSRVYALFEEHIHDRCILHAWVSNSMRMQIAVQQVEECQE